MAFTKLESGGIANDAVTSDQLANNIQFPGDYIVIPSGSTAQRPGSAVNGMLRYNTDTGLVEQYNAIGWQGIDSPPVVSGVSGIINENTNTTITISGSNFKPGAIVSIEGSAVGGVSRQLNTTYVNSTTLTASTAATVVNYTGGSAYDVKVTNPSGLTSKIDSVGAIDRDPVWVTSSGSLGSVYNGKSSSITISASDADSDSITYSVSTTPNGMSLSGNTISGTPSGYAGSQTTFPFTSTYGPTAVPLTATATANGTEITRSFSISVVDGYNPLNILQNYYLCSQFQDHATSNGTIYPQAIFDDECSGGGLVHGGESNAEDQNWYVMHFSVPIRINQVRIKGRNHPTAQYLGNWRMWYNSSAVTSYNGGGWNVAVSTSGYEPGTCNMGSWVSSSYSGYSRYWMFSMYGNTRGAYQAHAGMHIDYTI